MKKRDERLIVVLGMHRSGTSVIARALQVIGIQLGNRLMPPFEGNNSKGFWEDVDINALNIEILHSLKSDWHFVAPLQPADVSTLCANGYLQRATELLQKKTDAIKLFGFKDPRTAKLLPFWKEVFTHGEWQVSYVIVIRHPLSVCASLAKRDGFDFEKSFLLWLEHVISSLMGTVGQNRVVVDYDQLMQAPEADMTRIAKELQLSVDRADLNHFQAEFLDQNLQHTIYHVKDLMSDSIPPLVQEIYSTLIELVVNNGSLDHSAVKDRMEGWNQEFSRMRSTLRFVDNLGSRLTATAAERDTLLIEKTQLRQALQAQEQRVQQLTTQILGIYQSRSWRWTEPLRKLSNLFRQTK